MAPMALLLRQQSSSGFNPDENESDDAWLVVALPTTRTDNLCVRKSQLMFQLSIRPVMQRSPAIQPGFFVLSRSNP